MNRQQRRGHIKRSGGNWPREQTAKRHADEMDTAALRMSPEEARRALAEWAARPGHSQAEVNALNGEAKHFNGFSENDAYCSICGGPCNHLDIH